MQLQKRSHYIPAAKVRLPTHAAVHEHRLYYWNSKVHFGDIWPVKYLRDTLFSPGPYEVTMYKG